MKLLPLCTLGLLTVLTPFTVVQAADDSANLLRDPNQLSRNDVRLSGEKFFKAWLAQDNTQQQLKANMYLLGVMDATEGKAWCGYQQALPGSLRENVYSYFKKLPDERIKQPAAMLITEALAKELPCKQGATS
ncbi:Rap1a/Tai family immunity protein [Klebsiella aerogenes]